MRRRAGTRRASSRLEPDGTPLIPDRRGDNRLDALRHIFEDNRVSVIIFVPGAADVLRVYGTARITADPSLTAGFAEHGKTPATVLVVGVTELFMRCATSIMRSRLGGGMRRPVGLPTMGDLIASHRADGQVDASEYDWEAPSRLDRTMG